MNPEDVDIHDTLIYRVVEDTEKDTLMFEVDYPIDWDQNVYERREIIFSDVLHYKVCEIPFSGPPTILNWSVVGVDHGRDVIRIDTNAGYRQLAYKKIWWSVFI